jgi:hypothetical protein
LTSDIVMMLGAKAVMADFVMWIILIQLSQIVTLYALWGYHNVLIDRYFDCINSLTVMRFMDHFFVT